MMLLYFSNGFTLCFLTLCKSKKNFLDFTDTNTIIMLAYIQYKLHRFEVYFTATTLQTQSCP